MLKDNPEYKIAFHSEVHNIDIYMPMDLANGYHTTRHVSGNALTLFAASGATKELQGHFYEEIKKICNEAHSTRDIEGYMKINTLMDNLLYRHQYPIDEDCAIRVGANYCFIEGEDPNQVQDFWLHRKINLAKGTNETPADPDLYAFFLLMGVQFTPNYQEQLNLLDDSAYFQNRTEMLRTLWPQSLTK